MGFQGSCARKTSGNESWIIRLSGWPIMVEKLPFDDTSHQVVVQQHFNLVAVRQPARLPLLKLISVTDIAALVRQARQDRGWTQVQLAEHSGVSRDWIIALEKAKPSLEIALVLRTLKALNLSLKMERSVDQPPPDDVIDVDDLLESPCSA